MQTETPTPSRDDAPPSVPEAPVARDPSPRRVFWGLRARIVFWSILGLAIAVLAGVLVVRQAFLVQLDNRIDDALVQEADELRSLSRGRDPLTGERFDDDVRRIFEVFLDRNVPARNEAYLAFVDGRLIERRDAAASSSGLTDHADLMDRWASLETSERGRIDTVAGTVDYLAVPIDAGGEVLGVFVIAHFRDLETAQLTSAVNAAIEVGLIVLLIGSALAWVVAGRLLAPLRALTTTARSISTARPHAADPGDRARRDRRAGAHVQRDARPARGAPSPASGAFVDDAATSCARRSRSSAATSSCSATTPRSGGRRSRWSRTSSTA